LYGTARGCSKKSRCRISAPPTGAPLLDELNDARRVVSPAGEMETVRFTRPGLKGDFILGMKHTALYTALLPALTRF